MSMKLHNITHAYATQSLLCMYEICSYLDSVIFRACYSHTQIMVYTSDLFVLMMYVFTVLEIDEAPLNIYQHIVAKPYTSPFVQTISHS